MTLDWNILDIVFILITFVSILAGMLRGFVKELLSITFLILAVVLSILFYRDAGRLLNRYLNNSEISDFTGFIVIFTMVLIAGSLITFLLRKLIVIGPLRSIDRILGSVFGFFRAVLLCSIVLFGIIAFPGDRSGIIKESQFAPHFFKVIKVIMGFIPEHIKKNIRA